MYVCGLHVAFMFRDETFVLEVSVGGLGDNDQILFSKKRKDDYSGL